MLVFHNPGLIDLNAVRTMGVSVKKPGSFGFFGTGVKFAIATVLRGGGTVTIMADAEYEFGTTKQVIRGEDFNIVRMRREGGKWEKLGFTDQLGKNWEPWMVLREFGCNALDEDGEFHHQDADDRVIRGGGPGRTSIIVDWPALDEAYCDDAYKQVFIGNRPLLLETKEVAVHEGESQFLFYRGIRAYKLENPSVVTYNILSQQTLSEDRNLAHFYYPMGEIRALWLTKCEDQGLLTTVLCPARNPAFEHSVDYTATEKTPSRAFLDTVMDARDRRDAKLTDHAKNALHKYLRKETVSSGYGRRTMDSAFSQVVEAIGELIDNDPFDLDSVDFVMVDSLDDDALAMVENDRLYVSRELLKQPKNVIATRILHCLFDLHWQVDAKAILIEALLEQHSATRSKPERGSEDMVLADEVVEAAPVSVANALLVGMGVRGEETPVFYDEETSAGGVRDPRLAEL